MAKLTLGQTITLPAGMPMGMGKLRQAMLARVVRVHEDDNGEPIYTVSYRGKDVCFGTIISK